LKLAGIGWAGAGAGAPAGAAVVVVVAAVAEVRGAAVVLVVAAAVVVGAVDGVPAGCVETAADSDAVGGAAGRAEPPPQPAAIRPVRRAAESPP
jgi:hypothetical protein